MILLQVPCCSLQVQLRLLLLATMEWDDSDESGRHGKASCAKPSARRKPRRRPAPCISDDDEVPVKRRGLKRKRPRRKWSSDDELREGRNVSRAVRVAKTRAPRVNITVGSDCAGLLTEGLALEMLGVQHEHLFVSESNTNVRHLIYSVYGKRMHIYKDCSSRDLDGVPGVQLYVFGFPCQPFSPAGKGKGLDDPRGQILLHCLEYVQVKQPVLVIAENSARFSSCKFKDVRTMMINKLEESGYKVWHEVINTREQGLPQSRPRFYLVAIMKKNMVKKFEFPGEIQPIPLAKLLESARPDFEASSSSSCKKSLKAQQRIAENVEAARKKLESKGILPESCMAVVDVSASHTWSNFMVDCSPCLTASRCTGGGHYLMQLRRKMTTKEMCRLQGIPDGRFDYDKAKVPKSALLHAVGNAMTSCVLARILARALPAAGLVEQLDMPDSEHFVKYLVKEHC